ncbi:MAG: chemotaxis protein CheX [Spirochaetia bacterium]
MRVDYINPFVEAAFTVVEQVLSTPVERGNIYLKGVTQSIMGVATIVGLAGSVEGRVILDMDIPTALKVASIMNDEDLNEIDDLVRATITELANVVTGVAVTELHENGFKFDLTPPAIITGENMEIHDIGIEALVVPMGLPFGKIEINVAIKEREVSVDG